MSAGRRRRPFAKAERWTSGWYAVARGMCSGPWGTEDEARTVVDKWNAATAL